MRVSCRLMVSRAAYQICVRQDGFRLQSVSRDANREFLRHMVTSFGRPRLLPPPPSPLLFLAVSFSDDAVKGLEDCGSPFI